MALMIFPDRARVLSGFHRVLREGGYVAVSVNTTPEHSLTGGRVLVRTVAPEVALQAWVPFRFFPKVAHVFVH